MNAKETVYCRMYQIVLALAVFVCGLPGTAHAQQASGIVPQFELSGAYSYLRANPGNASGGYNLNGGSTSLAYNFTERFSVLGEFGVYRFSGLPTGLSSTMYAYLFGPRVSLRKSTRFHPFAQGLLGGGRLKASASGVSAGENGFAMAVGGGLGFSASRHLAIRLVEADYLLTRFALADGSSATQNNVRISFGLVYRFGTR